MNLNKAIAVGVAGAGVWYAMTGNTQALKIFVGVTGAMALMSSFAPAS